jgi:DNA modification methylase
MRQYLQYVWVIALSLDFGHKMFGYRIFTKWRPVLVMRKPGARRKHAWIVDRTYAGTYDKSLHKWQQGIEPAIKYITTFANEGDIVLDPFSGSGTTAVACIRTGRNFLAYDVDPEAVRITAERIELERPENRMQIPLFT